MIDDDAAHPLYETGEIPTFDAADFAANTVNADARYDRKGMKAHAHGNDLLVVTVDGFVALVVERIAPGTYWAVNAYGNASLYDDRTMNVWMEITCDVDAIAYEIYE